MFSISELALASKSGIVLMGTSWLGSSRPACFSSPTAVPASMQAFRTGRLSRSALGEALVDCCKALRDQNLASWARCESSGDDLSTAPTGAVNVSKLLAFFRPYASYRNSHRSVNSVSNHGFEVSNDDLKRAVHRRGVTATFPA